MIARQLLTYVIRPTLALLPEPMRGPAAERLLLGIAAHESGLGTYISQYPSGPARGLYQMQGQTFNTVLDWLDKPECHELHNAMLQVVVPERAAHPRIATPEQLTWNLKLSTLAARLYLWQDAPVLPAAKSLLGLAGIWHRAWCRGCSGSVAQWLASYHKYIGDRHVDPFA